MNLKQKALMSVGALGVAAAVAAGGSFATFNAQTSNPSTFATGTLVMSNSVNSATACLSTGAGTNTDSNVNDSCGALFGLTVQKPGDSDTANLEIKNAGTLDAAALKSFATGCTDGDAAGTYHGSGLPCSAVQLYIQQTDSSYAANTACLYGGTSAANTCDFSDETATLGAFTSSHGDSGAGLDLGALAHGTSDYFVIGVKLPDTADNTYQGRQATVGLSWYMQ